MSRLLTLTDVGIAPWLDRSNWSGPVAVSASSTAMILHSTVNRLLEHSLNIANERGDRKRVEYLQCNSEQIL